MHVTDGQRGEARIAVRNKVPGDEIVSFEALIISVD